MNYPFDFTFDGADQIGIVCNPHGATVTDGVPNTLIQGVASGGNLLRVGLMPPTGEVIVTGLSVMTDDAGGAPVGLGYFDTVASAFVEVYRVHATNVAGGGIARDFGDGFHLPLGPTKILGLACFSSAGVVSGDVRLYPVNDRVAEGATQYSPVLDDDGTPVLDSDYNPIYQG